ncbi:MAG: protoporphyrinogen oxidase HemJ [Stenotrophobium sp.]
MLWIKAFHIIFVVAWFAGLFYLPRLFVYHTEVTDAAEHQRFCTMERKLFMIMSIGMTGTVALGLWLWIAYWPVQTGWLHAKFGLAILLIAFHHWLLRPMKAFRRGDNRHTARFYRIVNEIPAVFLVALVILAVVKPF